MTDAVTHVAALPLNRAHGERRAARGTTLIELLVVIVVLSAILTFVSVLLVTLLRFSRQTSELVAWQATWHRLSIQWRDDVHQARDVETSEQADTLTLIVAPEATIEYALKPGELQRVERSGGGPVRRESFGISPAYEVALRTAERAGRSVALVELSRRDDVQAGASRGALPMRIVAYIGRDRPDASRRKD